MKWNLPLIGMLLLSACATMTPSADAICSVPTPRFTLEELGGLSTQSLMELDLYIARIKAVCN